MRRYLISLLFVMVIAGQGWAAGQDTSPPAGSGAPPAASPAPVVVDVDSTYPIGPGDVIGISVWKDEALTKDVVVLPDGTISFPLLGLIKAAGKTVAQLKAELEEKISQYVPEPTLNVELRQVNSLVVYVIGRVNVPTAGKLQLNTNIDVLQALAMAGGLNPFAKRDKIKIFRKEGEKTRTYAFNYDQVTEGKHLEQNIELKRGDIIVVP